ncbi:MAG: CHASE2 domain-containing protein [Cyanobacteriota bacterium]|nr:CHASE2 domain-containing protein [Cyanobacteriota bacterium]
MSKTVDLRIDGYLRESELRVILQIKENRRTILEIKGDLPANPELADRIEDHWLKKYRQLQDNFAVRALQAKGVKVKSQMSVLKAKIQECKTSEILLRDRVNQWLDTPSFQKVVNALRDYLKFDEEIRFIVRPEDELLYKLPWDVWHLIESRTLAQSAFGSQQFARSVRSQKIPSKNKVKILAILGHRAGLDNIEKEKQIFENLHPQAEVVFLDEPSSENLKDELWEQNWDIIFFAGHSETQEARGVISINPREQLTLDEESQLWFGLRKAVERGLQLVIFNSCDGWGLARRLDDIHIPIAIVMREMVLDQVAYSFLKYFLREYINERQDLYVAFRKARERLRDVKVRLGNREEEIEFPCGDLLPIVWQNPAFEPMKWDELLPVEPVVPRAKIPRSRPGLKWRTALLLSLVVTVLIIGARSRNGLQSWEMKAYDATMRLRSQELRDPRLAIITIDDDDIVYQKQQGMQVSDSLADEALAQLLEKLDSHPPRVIGATVVRDGPILSPKLRDRYQRGDRLFVSCKVKIAGDGETGVEPPPYVPHERHSFTNIVRDRDGTVRRYLLFMDRSPISPCQTHYSLGTQLARRYLEDEAIEPQFQQGRTRWGRATFQHLQRPAGGYQRDNLDGAQVLLNYRDRLPETISLTDALMGKANLELLEDRIVLIGPVTSTISQYYPTPYTTGQPSYQGLAAIFVHAQATSQIVSAVLDNRTILSPLPGWMDGMWIWGWSMATAILLLFIQRPVRQVVLFCVVLGLVSALSYGLFLWGSWVPLVPAIFAIAVTGSGAIVLLKVIRYW